MNMVNRRVVLYRVSPRASSIASSFGEAPGRARRTGTHTCDPAILINPTGFEVSIDCDVSSQVESS